jgi:hypothetical protein
MPTVTFIDLTPATVTRRTGHTYIHQMTPCAIILRKGQIDDIFSTSTIMTMPEECLFFSSCMIRSTYDGRTWQNSIIKRSMHCDDYCIGSWNLPLQCDHRGPCMPYRPRTSHFVGVTRTASYQNPQRQFPFFMTIKRWICANRATPTFIS